MLAAHVARSGDDQTELFSHMKICALPDGQFAHASHAAIARRVVVSQARGSAEPPKSAASFRASRLVTSGVLRSSRT
jgi:hypothetical protein